MKLMLQKFVSNGREKAGQANTVHLSGRVHNKIFSRSFAITIHRLDNETKEQRKNFTGQIISPAPFLLLC
jgi:hypothetical protein